MKLYLGPNQTILSQLTGITVDALVTDPPAGVGMLGKSWDTFDKARFIAYVADVLRRSTTLMRGGAYALIWTLPRTQHWTMTAIEDSGLVIKDVVTHLSSHRFPKARSCLKAAAESWVLAYKPAGKMRPLSIDDCLIPTTDNLSGGAY